MEFFSISNHSEKQQSATVQIMDQIGYNWWTEEGTEASEFMAAVRALGELKEVALEINSPGGNVHQGVSIANFIKGHPAKWVAKVVGNAASIASVIACACDTVEMGVGTNFLVHKPSSLLYGMVNADEARDLANNLDTIETSASEFYLPRIEAAGKTVSELEDLMREDRYMTADEAIEWGFADSRTVDIQAVACVDTHITAAKNLFASQQADQSAQTATLNARIKELETENTELKNPVLATNEAIIVAFKDADLSAYVAEYIDKEMKAEDLAGHIASLKALEDVCAAKCISFSVLAKDLANPVALVTAALNEFEANEDQDIDGQFREEADEEQKGISNKDYFNRRKQPAKRA